MSRKGITLIEILVVLTILSILVLCFHTVFKTGLDSWHKAQTKLERYQNVRVALDQISRDLASAVRVEDVRSFRGTGNSVSFMIMTEDSIYEVTYGVSGETLNRSYDERADFDFTTLDETEYLADHISAIEFQYLQGGSFVENWTDDGTDTGAARFDLPRAVRITLTVPEESREFATVVYIPCSD